jgi:hypothetical protein
MARLSMSTCLQEKIAIILIPIVAAKTTQYHQKRSTQTEANPPTNLKIQPVTLTQLDMKDTSQRQQLQTKSREIALLN